MNRSSGSCLYQEVQKAGITFTRQTLKGETLMSTTDLRQRLNDLFGYIRQGRSLRRSQEFYDKNAAMQENANPRPLAKPPTSSGKSSS